MMLLGMSTVGLQTGVALAKPVIHHAHAAHGKVKAYLYLTVVGSGLKLGSDGKTHDTYLPGDFTLEKGVPTEIVIANYDEGPHTLTSSTLGINISVKPRRAQGVAGITTAVVTANKTGVFDWTCNDPCDAKAGGWAMGQQGYMQGKITVQ